MVPALKKNGTQTNRITKPELYNERICSQSLQDENDQLCQSVTVVAKEIYSMCPSCLIIHSTVVKKFFAHSNKTHMVARMDIILCNNAFLTRSVSAVKTSFLLPTPPPNTHTPITFLSFSFTYSTNPSLSHHPSSCINL